VESDVVVAQASNHHQADVHPANRVRIVVDDTNDAELRFVVQLNLLRKLAPNCAL
jgi:hypothetical protein